MKQKYSGPKSTDRIENLNNEGNKELWLEFQKNTTSVNSTCPNGFDTICNTIFRNANIYLFINGTAEPIRTVNSKQIDQALISLIKVIYSKP